MLDVGVVIARGVGDRGAQPPAVIEALFRGNHQRHLDQAVAERKRGGRADRMHSKAQKDAAATVIQRGMRLRLGILERDRENQIRQLRALRGHADDERWWGRIQYQFQAASHSQAFVDAFAAGQTITHASW